MAKAEEDAISRATDDERKIAQKEYDARTGGKKSLLIVDPEYVLDKGLGASARPTYRHPFCLSL